MANGNYTPINPQEANQKVELTTPVTQLAFTDDPATNKRIGDELVKLGKTDLASIKDSSVAQLPTVQMIVMDNKAPGVDIQHNQDQLKNMDAVQKDMVVQATAKIYAMMPENQKKPEQAVQMAQAQLAKDGYTGPQKDQDLINADGKLYHQEKDQLKNLTENVSRLFDEKVNEMQNQQQSQGRSM